MATHPSILAWEIPWAAEPHEPQSLGVSRVRHDLASKQSTSNQFSKISCVCGREGDSVELRKI